VSYQATAAVFDNVPGSVASGADRLVLLALAHHASAETMECWPSIALLAVEAGVSGDTVRRSLRNLESAGLIERKVNGAPDERIPKDRRPNLYRLHVTGGTSTGGRKTRTRGTGGRETRQRGGDLRVHGGDDRAPLIVMEDSKNAEPLLRVGLNALPVDNLPAWYVNHEATA
jgi:hypothetical protein